MKKKLKYSLGVFMILTFWTYGQSHVDLVDQKEILIKETEVLNRALTETKHTQTNTLEKLKIINKKISAQESLLEIYNKKIQKLTEEQLELDNKIIIINKSLNKLKKNYAKLIRVTQRSMRGHNRVLFFLSAQNFNQLLRRGYHFRQLTIDRRKKHEEIQKTRIELDVNKQLLIRKKSEQSRLVLEKKSEIKSLGQTKKDKKNTIKNLINKKDSLIREIKIKEAETKKITQIILELLESEKNKTNNLTPELKLISSNFQSNKGRLPWPVGQGSIVSKFGKVAHPVLSGITLMNNGVEISTPNNEVRAVFDGEISKIIVLPTGLKVVIVKHGDYLTVYSNLQKTNAQKGQKIKTKEPIGTLHADGDTKNKLLGFQVWRGREKLNPTQWISGH